MMGQKVSIQELETLMRRALSIRGVSDSICDLIIADYLGAELQGRYSHGLGKFLLIDDLIRQQEGEPVVAKESEVWTLIDGNRSIGQNAASFAIDHIIQKAKRHGVSVCGLYNFSRYSRLSVVAKRIAQSGLAAIVMNNGGPAAVAPYGSIDPILGTNPISFAFPLNEGVSVFDFSTSERTWGEIRQAILEERDLPIDIFLDSKGQYTVDPKAVSAVRAFGGPKGAALCIAIEILTGILLPAKAGLKVNDQFDLAATFIAIDPSIFGSLNSFQDKLEVLLSEIRNSRASTENAKVIIPGERSNDIENLAREKGEVNVPENILYLLEKMASDASASGLQPDNLTD